MNINMILSTSAIWDNINSSKQKKILKIMFDSKT